MTLRLEAQGKSPFAMHLEMPLVTSLAAGKAEGRRKREALRARY